VTFSISPLHRHITNIIQDFNYSSLVLSDVTSEITESDTDSSAIASAVRVLADSESWLESMCTKAKLSQILAPTDGFTVEILSKAVFT